MRPCEPLFPSARAVPLLVAFPDPRGGCWGFPGDLGFHCGCPAEWPCGQYGGYSSPSRGPDPPVPSRARFGISIAPLRGGSCFLLALGVTRVSMEVAGCWGCCNPRTAHTATQDSNSGSPSPQGSPNMPPWGLGRPLGHCRGAGDGQTAPCQFRLSAGCSVRVLKPAPAPRCA